MKSGELCKYLRELRGGMTLRKAGELSGLSIAAISRCENGKRRPTVDMLIKLAPVYNVTRDELLAVAGYIDEVQTEEQRILMYYTMTLTAEQQKELIKIINEKFLR